MPTLPDELLILRHAKASEESGTGSDFERPLAPRGRRDAPLLGRWLRERELVPDRVLASPARRARQTLELVLEALGEPDCPVEHEERLYGAALPTLLELIGERADTGRLLVVAHNPGLEHLVTRLGGPAAAPPPGVTRFPTAALAHFRGGSLLEIVRPRTLGDLSA